MLGLWILELILIVLEVPQLLLLFLSDFSSELGDLIQSDAPVVKLLIIVPLTLTHLRVKGPHLTGFLFRLHSLVHDFIRMIGLFLSDLLLFGWFWFLCLDYDFGIGRPLLVAGRTGFPHAVFY